MGEETEKPLGEEEVNPGHWGLGAGKEYTGVGGEHWGHWGGRRAALVLLAAKENVKAEEEAGDVPPTSSCQRLRGPAVGRMAAAL